MKTINLSLLDLHLKVEDVINYCLDNNINTIINDIATPPHVEYSLDDLYSIWGNFKNLKK